MSTDTTSIVRRTSLFVRNMERALTFYRGVFGFSVYHHRTLDVAVVPAVPLGAAPRGGQIRLVILRGTDPLVGMIGLMEVSEPPLPEPDHDPRRLGLGSVALVVSTADAAGAAAQVEALGGAILMPVTEGRNIGDGAGNLVPAKLFMAFDPDGHFLEVFEPL